MRRLHELSEKHGATQAKYFDAAVGALKVALSAEDIGYLEELYTPHSVVGAL